MSNLDYRKLLLLPKYQQARDILEQVSGEMGVLVRDICGPSKSVFVQPARRKVIWRLRHEAKMSMPKIGKLLSRDHTTILHALKRYAIEQGEANLYVPDTSRPFHPNQWRPHEDEILRRAFAEGLSDEEISRIFAAAGNVRIPTAIQRRRSRIRLMRERQPAREKPAKVVKAKPFDPSKVTGPKADSIRFAVAVMAEAGAKNVGELKAYVRRQELDLPPEKPFVYRAPPDETRSFVGSHFSYLPSGKP